MNKEATFQQVIDMCNKVGWDKGISELEKIVNQTENMQCGQEIQMPIEKLNMLEVIMIKVSFLVQL
jgi:hypothetical protein